MNRASSSDQAALDGKASFAFALLFRALAFFLGALVFFTRRPAMPAFAVVRDFEEGPRGEEPRAELFGERGPRAEINALQNADRIATPDLDEYGSAEGNRSDEQRIEHYELAGPHRRCVVDSGTGPSGSSHASADGRMA